MPRGAGNRSKRAARDVRRMATDPILPDGAARQGDRDGYRARAAALIVCVRLTGTCSRRAAGTSRRHGFAGT